VSTHSAFVQPMMQRLVILCILGPGYFYYDYNDDDYYYYLN